MIKRVGIAAALLALLTLGGWWVQGTFMTADVEGRTAAEPSSTASAEEPQDIKVLKLTGQVERNTGNGWEPLRVGYMLTQDSVIRTKQGAAVLGVGENAQVEVAENSQFRLGEVTNNLSKVKLEGGRIEARVHGGGDERLAVEVLGSDMVAETSDGEFAVMRNDDALVTVASRKGEVRVAAQGEKVTVKEGQLSTIQPQQPPSIPEKIPGSLFLKLTNKPKSRQRENYVMLEGETTPGAVVSVGGVRVSARDGKFAAKVPLKEGQNELTLRVDDALGRQAEQALPKVFVDSRAPKNNSRVEW